MYTCCRAPTQSASQPLLIHVSQPLLIHVSQPLLIHVSQPLLIHVSQPLLIHVSQPLLIHVSQPLLIHTDRNNALQTAFPSPKRRTPGQAPALAGWRPEGRGTWRVPALEQR